MMIYTDLSWHILMTNILNLSTASLSCLFYSECNWICFSWTMYVIFYKCQKKIHNNCQILLKREEISIPIVFKGVLFHGHAILLPFFIVCSTWTRVTGNCYLYIWQIKQIICIPLMYSKCNDYRINILPRK